MCAKYVVLYKMWLLLGLIWVMVLCNSISQVDGRPQDGDNVAQDDHAPQGTSLFQGDIILADDDFLWLGRTRPGVADAITDPKRKWEKDGAEVLIPYRISPGFLPIQENQIHQAFAKIADKTCIRFEPFKKHDNNYVDIKKGDRYRCSSWIGRNTTFRSQYVSLGDKCFDTIDGSIGIILHELMHVIGFWHEHSRTDRDEHVTIHDKNVDKIAALNFNQTTASEIQDLGLPYDFDSVMHYGPDAFANARDKITISALDPEESKRATFGQRDGLSELDVRGINLLYNCVNDLAPPLTDGKEEHRLCPYWARKGECAKKISYMSGFCKESCNKYGCPAGSYKTSGPYPQCFKYFVTDYKTTSRNWTEARDFCKGKGWKLATPNDNVNLEELSKYLMEKAGDWNKSVWLGARGSNITSGFLWEADVGDQPPVSSRSKLDKNHPGWWTSRWSPDQSHPTAVTKDYCLNMSPQEKRQSGHYFSSLCSRKKHTLCEL